MQNESLITDLYESIQLQKAKLKEYKSGFHSGSVSYDELSSVAKELSKSLTAYSKMKFPGVKIKPISHQSLLRNTVR